MGCDIYAYAEKKDEQGQWVYLPDVSPFDIRNYTLFSFLAGVRNYMNIIPVSVPRGFPDDASPEVLVEYMTDGDWHSASWLTIVELMSFDYGQLVGVREVGKAPRPVAAFLGEWYFDEIERLSSLGVERVVFWFDS